MLRRLFLALFLLVAAPVSAAGEPGVDGFHSEGKARAVLPRPRGFERPYFRSKGGEAFGSGGARGHCDSRLIRSFYVPTPFSESQVGGSLLASPSPDGEGDQAKPGGG